MAAPEAEDLTSGEDAWWRWTVVECAEEHPVGELDVCAGELVLLVASDELP